MPLPLRQYVLQRGAEALGVRVWCFFLLNNQYILAHARVVLHVVWGAQNTTCTQFTLTHFTIDSFTRVCPAGGAARRLWGGHRGGEDPLCRRRHHRCRRAAAAMDTRRRRCRRRPHRRGRRRCPRRRRRASARPPGRPSTCAGKKGVGRCSGAVRGAAKMDGCGWVGRAAAVACCLRCCMLLLLLLAATASATAATVAAAHPAELNRPSPKGASPEEAGGRYRRDARCEMRDARCENGARQIGPVASPACAPRRKSVTFQQSGLSSPLKSREGRGKPRGRRGPQTVVDQTPADLWEP